ncbi:sialate O-acetylesterase [Lacibacter sediminis]|uniref:Sialate O-acetylesterase n=1 Tax=Lacibacter sediminis TaxID=2760713 RepID=A0A7G5XDA5_9BACT|nr:sialate O-acetylesterase [Lacibacter sediminis]QNA43458.1 sialate O-acetylesterase [Lacibacter sediminis]
MRKYILVFTVLFFYASLLQAKIKLPAIIADGMVLQQSSKVKIWGETDKANNVTIVSSWNKKKYTVLPSNDGKWMMEIETPQAGGPYTLTLSDGESIVLKNILIGEVWFCSGQSNMEMPMNGYSGQPINGYVDALLDAKPSDNIRYFKVEKAYNNKKENDCKGKWLETSPTTLGNCSAAAYYFAKRLQKNLNVPVAVIISSWGGTRIEAWMDSEVLENQFPQVSLAVLKKDIAEVKNPISDPSLIYNAMINPLISYGIKGFLWYQGESNRFDPKLYKALFPAMVKSWREKWKSGDLPFYYVQIAPYNYNHPDSLQAAELRQSQFASLQQIPNSGMVVTADVGMATKIHPPQKDVVGFRLALLALAKTYKQAGIPFSGPMYKSAKTEKGKVVLDFDFAERGLHTTNNSITGFELAGADNKFYPAKASLLENATKIQLECSEIQSAVYVRYAYRNYAPVDIFNNWNLPLSPFFAEMK